MDKINNQDDINKLFDISVKFEPFDDFFSTFEYNDDTFEFNQCDEKHFLYRVEINISDMTLSNHSSIANIELYLVNLADCINYGKDIVWLHADDVTGDAEEIAMALNQKKFMDKCYDDEFMTIYSTKVYVGGLHTLYVEPQYRKSNLGRRLIKNLNNILDEFLNIQVAGLSAYVNPYDENKVYMYPERNILTKEQTVVVERLCKFLKHMGFKKIRNKKYYYFLDMTNTFVNLN